MKRMVAWIMLLCLMLSGCSEWMSSDYFSVVSHLEPSQEQNKPAVPVSSYSQLCKALISLIREGSNRGTVAIQYAEEEEIYVDMARAIEEVCRDNPFAVYSVDEITYEYGMGSSGKTVSVKIAYLQDRVRANEIQRVQSVEHAKRLVAQRLEAFETGVVLYVDNLEEVDYIQVVEDYALANPQTIMEIPEVAVTKYPEEGSQRIIEMKFTYKTNREELRALRNKVALVFASAMQHSTGNWTVQEKLTRLYSFLMERYDEYHIQSSRTPAYSLLLHGVGDSKAFAMVYSAMCRQISMECKVVIGTYNGAPWAWNVVRLDGVDYHIDLLRCSQERKFQLRTAEELEEYVWDYAV